MIHDNIHGTLEFNKSERKIINSPLLQRLTHIHQMGLANYVYPDAVHNRFTHSLGVAHLAGEIYKSIKKDKLNKQELISLKLAGLLHDIGHGPFSHVTDTKLFKLLVDLPEDRKRKIRIDYDIYYLPKKLAKRKNPKYKRNRNKSLIKIDFSKKIIITALLFLVCIVILSIFVQLSLNELELYK